MLEKIYNTEFYESRLGFGIEASSNMEDISFEDQKLLKLMDEKLRKVGEHFDIPLPLKNRLAKLPNNRNMAEKRLHCLKSRFIRNPEFFADYKGLIEDFLIIGFAKKSTEKPPDGRTWYIPHHGVYHPNKPGKIRVVFDCSADFKEISLNKKLMDGPDLANQIVGVIIRFHEESVVIMGDIESMFHQVLVPENDRRLLRFLWRANHDIRGTVEGFEMKLHVFGATSSPSCCNYAVKRTAVDNEKKYHPDVVTTLQQIFYVDDLLKSVKDVKTAIRLLYEIIGMCASGGFKLTRVIRNRVKVLQSVTETERRKGVKNIDFNNGIDLPTERALGVKWNIENDQLGFTVNLGDKQFTRCGMLSTISKSYDPRGLAAPFLLKGKIILEDLCKNNYSWDENVPSIFIKDWESWKIQLYLLENVVMKRCFKPPIFGKIACCSLHHFLDASQNGYGQVSYL